MESASELNAWPQSESQLHHTMAIGQWKPLPLPLVIDHEFWVTNFRVLCTLASQRPATSLCPIPTLFPLPLSLWFGAFHWPFQQSLTKVAYVFLQSIVLSLSMAFHLTANLRFKLTNVNKSRQHFMFCFELFNKRTRRAWRGITGKVGGKRGEGRGGVAFVNALEIHVVSLTVNYDSLLKCGQHIKASVLVGNTFAISAIYQSINRWVSINAIWYSINTNGFCACHLISQPFTSPTAACWFSFWLWQQNILGSFLVATTFASSCECFLYYSIYMYVILPGDVHLNQLRN